MIFKHRFWRGFSLTKWTTFGPKWELKTCPNPLKNNPQTRTHKRPSRERFCVDFGALVPSKNVFSRVRGAKNHIFISFSLFLRILQKGVKKRLQITLEFGPKLLQIYHSKSNHISADFWALFDPPKRSKMDPFGTLGGGPGTSLGAQGCLGDSQGTPRAQFWRFWGPKTYKYVKIRSILSKNAKNTSKHVQIRLKTTKNA